MDRRLRCVLFDFDGVVADTEPSNFYYLEKALGVLGISLNDEQRRAILGVNDLEVLRPLMDAAVPPVTPERLAEEQRRQGNTYEDSAELQPNPGLRELLARLRQKGIRTGVVSSTSARLILAALNRMGLTGQFDVVLCGDMIRRRKPDPEGYRRAMELLGVRPEDCAVIEDSPAGIRAGLAAGAYVLGFAGSSLVQDTSRAHVRIGSFAECAALPLFRDALADEGGL